ncbi:MAG TPA: hypothetical protein VFW40_08700 [Capsulimonadaceae bacterium]|nr:hypothetical protein [Capsulimonadaceae bacterium]
METAVETERVDTPARKDQPQPRCPVCAEPMTDLYPKPRCRKCGYLQSCCNPDFSECEAA